MGFGNMNFNDALADVPVPSPQPRRALVSSGYIAMLFTFPIMSEVAGT